MVTKKTPSNIVVSVACGPVPCDTEKGRSFLQERQALFGKVCFLICLGLYVFLNGLETLSGGYSWFDWIGRGDNQLHLGTCVAFLAMFLVCRVGNLSHRQLALLDTFGTVLIGLLIGLNYHAEDMSKHTEYYGGVAITNILVLRAIVVPSSAPQTLVTSMLASIPVLVGFHAAFDDFVALGPVAGETAFESSPPVATAVLAAWCGVASAIATVASHIIYGLQQEVEGAKQLGQYTLEERIGRGGMGEVFKASHAMLRRPTAVKLLRPESAGERSLARFEREVQLTSRLTHPNTIAIYDYGHTPDGVFYYAMEYLDGFTLEDLVSKDGRQPAGRVIHILRQVCSSLVEAHGTGLIHRDVKPANIILCERGGIQDVVKVLDFGLVKDVETTESLDLSGDHSIMGSPLYMSPESIRAPEEVAARSDLYSLGAVGYYLLTGKELFESSNFVEICSHHLHTRPEPPSARIEAPIPKDLEDVILLCLEKDLAQRPQDAAALREALERCEDANGWTQEAAALWWKESAPGIKASAEKEKTLRLDAGSTRTDARTAMVPERSADRVSSEALTRGDD